MPCATATAPKCPQELLTGPRQKYATYYTTRKDNAWAEANPDEVQQEYLISDRHTARGTSCAFI